MPNKLTYFDVNGLAESIRYILHYTGQKFEDVRIQIKDWPVPEIKDNLSFGQLPVYEEDGRVLHQSIAIARYVAANTELLPSDPWEQALLDAAVLTYYDLNKLLIQFYYEKDLVKREEMRNKLNDEHIDFYLSRFEKQLKENNGHIGKKLSWADFVFVGLIELQNLYLERVIEKNYPLISALVKEIHALPRVREYIRDRPEYFRPDHSKIYIK